MRAEKNKKRASKASPPPELLPFLDALAEMVANALERDIAEIESRRARAASESQPQPTSKRRKQR